MSDLLSQMLSLDDSPISRDDYIRAPFGYPGAKSRSLPNLLSILPYRNTYAEPCGGSGAVLLSRRPCNLEVFNDRHAGITTLYRCIRDRKKCEELMLRLELATMSREEFIWTRETWESDFIDDVERAARWYYCATHSFNKKGLQFGRSTFGKAQAISYFNNLKLFWPIHNRLKTVQVENMDWRVILQDYDQKEAVWYIDPPYWGTTNTYKHEWTPGEHIEMCERAMRLQGYVAVSGYDADDHPYNKYSWDRKESWEVDITATGLAFQETNNLANHKDKMIRGKALETVWIRE